MAQPAGYVQDGARKQAADRQKARFKQQVMRAPAPTNPKMGLAMPQPGGLNMPQPAGGMTASASSGQIQQGQVQPLPAGGGSVPTSTNTADMDPTIAKQLALYNQRLGADPSKRAIQTSTLGIQDAAALSAADAKGIMSRRGILGSGAGDTFLQNKIFAPAQRQAAGAAAQIAQAEEQRKDNLVLGGVPLAQAPGNMAIQNKNLALNQQGQAFNQNFQTNQANWDRAFQAQQAQQAADQRAQDQLLNIFQQTGSVPGATPNPNPYRYNAFRGDLR